MREIIETLKRVRKTAKKTTIVVLMKSNGDYCCFHFRAPEQTDLLYVLVVRITSHFFILVISRLVRLIGYLVQHRYYTGNPCSKLTGCTKS